MPVREARNLRKCPEHVLEGDEEDEQEGHHEREEEERDAFRKDEQCFAGRRDVIEPERGVVKDRHDEFFAGDRKEEDAAEDRQGFPEQLEILRSFGPRVFEFVAEGRAEDVIGIVGEGQVLWISDGAQGGSKFEREIFADFGQRILLILVHLLLFHLVQFTQVGAGAGIADRRFRRGVLRIVQRGKTMFGRAEMAVVESVRMHLHQHHNGVKGEKDLGRPGPGKQERPVDPQGQPGCLIYALDHHSTLFPP